MPHAFRALLRLVLPATLGALPLLIPITSHAQVFGPPSTVFGSIADSSGAVGENVPVQAYIGSQLCGKGTTEFTGDGAARVTVYFVDVVAKEQTAGCGAEGADVHLEVGDRMATQTAKWKAGPVALDITFGGASPAPIPTFTPAPTRTPTPRPQGTPAAPAAGAAGAAATPGAPAAQGGSSGQAGTTAGTPAAAPSEASINGGVTSRPVSVATQPSSSGGFPVWGIILIVLAAVAVAGGSGGFLLARSKRAHDGDDTAVGPTDEV